MKTTKIYEYLAQIAKEYADSNEYVTDFKINDNDDASGVHELEYRFSSFSAVFVYNENGGEIHAKSSLLCRISFDTNGENDWHYQLYQLTDLLNPNDFRIAVFTYIENTQRMKACFEQLCGSLNEYTEQLNRIGADNGLKGIIKRRAIDEYVRYFKMFSPFEQYNEEEAEKKILYLDYLYDYESSLVQDHSAAGIYSDFANGKYKKAEKYLKKRIDRDNYTDHQMRLYIFLNSLQNGEKYDAIPDECNACKIAEKYIYGNSRGIDMLRGAAMLVLPLTLLLFSLSGLFSWMFVKNAVYSTSAPWYFQLLIAFNSAAFCSLFGSIAFQKRIIPKIHKKSPEKLQQAQDFDSLLNTERSYKAVKFIFSLIIAAAVVFMFLINAQRINFFEDSFTVANDNLCKPFSPAEYNYADIDSVVLSHGIYNEDGDYIERESYAVIMKNGTIIDLDGFDSVENTTAHILPIISKYCGEIKEVHSAKELYK